MKEKDEKPNSERRIADILAEQFAAQMEFQQEKERKWDAVTDGHTRFPYRKFSDVEVDE